MLASEVFSRVRDILADSTVTYRWSDAALMRWLSDGQYALARRRPDLMLDSDNRITKPNEINTTSAIDLTLATWLNGTRAGGATISNNVLTCGTTGTTLAATWQALVATGQFSVVIDGVAYTINPDFTLGVSLPVIAATIQTAIRAATGGTETVTYVAYYFTFTCALGAKVTYLKPVDEVSVGADYRGALADYVCSRGFSENDEDGDVQRAQMHMAAFERALST